MTATLGFTGRITHGTPRWTWATEDAALFTSELKRLKMAHPPLTQPDMGRLSKKARAVRFDPTEREGKFRLGAEVELELFASYPYLGQTKVTGQVWSLAPRAGVWVATERGFFYVARKDGAVREFSRHRGVIWHSTIGRAA